MKYLFRGNKISIFIMTPEEFMNIVRNQRIWEEQFKMENFRRHKYRVVIMSRHKSRGNKSASYIQEKLKELNNQHH
jgi:hypothetical protein